MLNHQMIADSVERIDVEPGGIGFREAFLELKIEDGEAKRLGGEQLVVIAGLADVVRRIVADQQLEGLNGITHQFDCARDWRSWMPVLVT